MRRFARPAGCPAIAACCAVLCLASVSLADVIILKNGRRITANNVKEAGDKIIGETSAGTITLPASMVDHVEGEAGGASRAAGLRLSPPQNTNEAGAGGQPAGPADGVDPALLQRLRREAISGDPVAAERAAALESAAGAWEFGRGNLDEALVHAERALAYDPTSTDLLLEVAYYRLRRAEYGPALETLQRARKAAPDSEEVAKLTGWAYYGLNRLAPAVEEWQRAQELQPNDEVAAALAKAQRDLEAEREFREDGSEHFVLKYDGRSAPELALGILRQLETDFQSVSAILNYDPSEKIGVLLYTNQAFADITRAPSWVGALNDGRIRIPVQGLTSVTPALARALRHELTHSLVGGKTRGRCPVWLQEGVAQWMDGSQITAAGAAKLLALYDRHEEPSLALLEGSWMKLDRDFAANAYGWSLAVVESLARAGGASDIEHLLGRVATETNTESAVRSSLHFDYAGLMRFTADYLRKNYSR
jgi:tetratricopeptide (TPR) repeat protein